VFNKKVDYKLTTDQPEVFQIKQPLLATTPKQKVAINVGYKPPANAQAQHHGKLTITASKEEKNIQYVYYLLGLKEQPQAAKKK